MEQISKKYILLVKNTKKWTCDCHFLDQIFSLKQVKHTQPWNFTYSNYSFYQISLEQTILNFWTKFAQERYGQNRKSEHHHWIPLIQISLGTKFQLKLTILIFWPDLSKKGFSGLKQKKWIPHIFYIILHIQISQVRNFSWNWQFSFFGSNLHKDVFGQKLKKLTSLNFAYSN